MPLRNTSQLELAVPEIIRDQALRVSGVDIVSTWLNPIPITLDQSSRFASIGSLILAIITLFATLYKPSLSTGFILDFVACILLYWSIIRLYYDTRYLKGQPLILLPPNASNNVLTHELLHVHLGDIVTMSKRARAVAMSPVGPFLFWRRAWNLDFGKSAVRAEMKRRGLPDHPIVTPGLIIMIATAFASSFLTSLFLFVPQIF